MPEKVPPWAPLVAVWWEGCVGGGKEKSSRLRSKPHSNNLRKRSNKHSYKGINALLAPAWTPWATA